MMNVQQAIASFLQHGQSVRNLSDRTLRAYESDLVQFKVHLSRDEMVSVTETDLEEYISKLGTGSYRDTSIRRKVAALKVFFRYLEDHGIVSESPARRLKIKQPVEVRVPNVLSMKEIKSLLSAPKRQMKELAVLQEQSAGARNRYFCAVRDNVIIELLFSTGIRIGELVALDVSDVDKPNRRLKITGRATRGRYIDLTSDIVLNTLSDYMALRGERGVENTALFVGRSGTRLTIYSIENIFKKHVRSADIKRHVTPHALRHTMAAMMINGGADIRDVQEILGHASILSTQVYTRFSPVKSRRTPSPMNQRDKITLDSSARLVIRKKS
ncbi:MAG TPA: tyrosine-type recombinase/integrase [Thermoanaerobaculia bacterium]|nr:tyrosine-type recombinase/integrase [Thermoanaerobaculia bacterium]